MKIDSPGYFKTALRAKYWITNTNIQRGLSFKKKNQIYLNTWHGIPLKHIGNDCPGRKDYHFGSVDYLIVSGDYEEQVFKSAFHAREDRFLRCGMPRNEALWLADQHTRWAMREKLGIPRGNRVILYAPTWRDSRDKGRSYAIEPPIHAARWKAALGEDSLVLFRAHHQSTRVLGIQFDDFIRDVSHYPDVNDLMIAADFLITDYSAIAFDYSILCRPIFCYAYDYDSYLAERGTYFSVDEKYPNKSVLPFVALSHVFIGLWSGSANYVLGLEVPLLIAADFYIGCVYYPLREYILGLGLFKKGKYSSYACALCNALLSLIGVQFWGIQGVLLATVIAQLVIWLGDGIIILRGYYGGNRDYLREYVTAHLGYAGLLVFCCILSSICLRSLALLPDPAELLLGAAMDELLFFCTVVIVFRNRDEFQYTVSLIKTLFRKVLQKKMKYPTHDFILPSGGSLFLSNSDSGYRY